MDVITYTTTDEAEKVTKTLTNAATYENVTMKDPTDTVHPVVTIQTTANLSSVNYMRIERYGRYYFVEKPIAVKNGVWELHCTSDPLMSFKDSLLNVSGTVTRSETLFNAYLNDPEYKAYAYSNIVTKQFPNAVNQDTFILMTVGGGSGVQQ